MSLINHYEKKKNNYNKNIVKNINEENNKIYKNINDSIEDNYNIYKYENTLTINEIYKNQYIQNTEYIEYLSNINEIIIEQYENNPTSRINPQPSSNGLTIQTTITKKKQRAVKTENIFNYFTKKPIKNENNKPNNVQKYKFVVENNKDIEIKETCPNCHQPLNNLLVDNKLICQNCGFSENKTMFCSPENNESVKKINYPYKRLNHLKEYLNQLQAKEMINIPEEVKLKIINELKKKKFNDLKVVKYEDIKTIVKTLKLNKYYDHCVYLTVLITGKQPPILKKQEEKEIYTMFQNILNVYESLDSKKRVNFLNYSYVLHKIFQLTNNRTFVKLCPLLKSNDKLIQQDIIWKKICNALDWKYIPSL